jgi:hypothetical protein
MTPSNSDHLDPDLNLPTPLDDPSTCDHDFQFHDDSFDHEFGTEIVRYWLCEKCGMSTPHNPHENCFLTDHDLD